VNNDNDNDPPAAAVNNDNDNDPPAAAMNNDNPNEDDPSDDNDGDDDYVPPPDPDTEDDSPESGDDAPPVAPRARARARAQPRDPVWKWRKCSIPHVPKDIDNTAREGIMVDMPDNPNEWDFLNLYLTDEILEVIVRETNLYAEQFQNDNSETIKQFSNVKNWEGTNINEIKTYLAMVVLMGIVHKPRLNMYWSTDTILETPIFSKVMTRDKFLLLTKFIHFADNTLSDPRDPDRDRLHKIREVCEMFRRQWKAVYSPGRDLCIDESLVLFKGRLAFKQYIRTKRSRFGIKFYTLSTDNGITLDNMIYCGRLAEELDIVDGYLTTEKIAITLMRDYVDEGRVLYLDNFYTTPKLAQFFLEHGTYMVGTCRTNRKNFPKDLGSTMIPKGTSMFFSAGDVLAVKYRSHKDKSDGKPKVVHLITTQNTNVVRATNKTDKDGEAVKKPTAVLDYNTHMGGVDMIDQQLHQIQCLRKNYKWYKKTFLRLLMQSMLNAHKLHNLATNGRQDFLGYLHQVIIIMFQSTPRLEQNPRVVPHDSVFRITGHQHFPMRRPLPETSQRKKAKFHVKVCRVCTAQGKTDAPRTQWVCKNCPGQPGLHMDGCWEAWHMKQNVKQ
jgi:hypothetical protein